MEIRLLALGHRSALLALLLATALFPSADAGDRYENTFRKDFVMDAPWRVKNEHTAVPVTIILKDCDTDDIRELHWIRCWDETSGDTILWDHDFGDEQIGDDPYESNYWTYVTTATEGHPSLPDGTPLTPANLGYGPGDAIDLRVSVYYRDNIFNYTETRHLRVHVAQAAYPWPDGWYGGDGHFHTMYTNNTAEFGAPLPAVIAVAKAIGLHWLTATDHSCDLDETGDGSFSYATTHWEYTIQDEGGTITTYRDNTAFGTTWDVLGGEAALFDSPDLRLYRAVELNASSVDGDSYDKTLHSLFYNDAYIHSPLSGAIGERPVTPTLPDALSQLSGGGFAYAAHPLYDMSMEWGGLDLSVNGAAWGDEDYTAALAHEGFRGLEAFNTRSVRYSTDENDPWSDFDAGVPPDDPYPNELLAGIAQWDVLLTASLSPVRKIFLAGGSDAHGDFNYSTYFGLLDSYATDNAIAKVQTVVSVPGSYGPGNLPPMSEILAAYRAGRSVVTDGPFLEIGVDRSGDGDFDDPEDLTIGDDGSGGSIESLPLTIRWASTLDFGPVVSVDLIVGIDTGATTVYSLDPNAGGEGYAGEAAVDLWTYGLEDQVYLRAECRTDRGDDQFRAYTNPIWFYFDATSIAGSEEPGSLSLAVRGNPFVGTTALSFAMPEGGHATIAVYDVAGRLVRVLHDGHSAAGTHAACWDGTDGAGSRASAGIYFFRLEALGETIVRKGALLR